MAKGAKKLGIKVSAPRAKPADAGKFPHVSKPRLKPLQTRIYTKQTARKDPMEFTGIGFGNTGLTGES